VNTLPAFPGEIAVRAGAVAAAQPRRYESLDGLRGLLAFAVVIHHFSSTSGHREFLASAPLAVDFFFCLSGFVIAHAYERRLRAGMGIVPFMRRRLVRLYPMFLIGALLGAGALFRLGSIGASDLSPGQAGIAALLNVLYLPYLNLAAIHVVAAVIVGALFPINNPAWSLFFELLVNAFYGLIARIGTAGLALIVALGAGALVLAWNAYGEAPGWGTSNALGGLARVVYLFFAGVLIYRLRPAARLGTGAYGAVVALVVVLVAIPRIPEHSVYWLAACLLAVPPVVALASTCEPGPRARRLCDYSGRISYPVYCLHYPLLMLLPPAEGVGRFTYLAELVAYVAVTWLVSHLLLVHIDEPVRKWLTQREARPT
jgi:peptidoglycan/LPS O-acetylase OafA/YrhL